MLLACLWIAIRKHTLVHGVLITTAGCTHSRFNNKFELYLCAMWRRRNGTAKASLNGSRGKAAGCDKLSHGKLLTRFSVAYGVLISAAAGFYSDFKQQAGS